MAVTEAEVTAGKAALEDYADSQSWKARFVPDKDYAIGTADVITAADAASDQSEVGRATAGVGALRAALNVTGEGSQVTDEMIVGGTDAILAAVATLRAQEKSAP